MGVVSYQLSADSIQHWVVGGRAERIVPGVHLERRAAESGLPRSSGFGLAPVLRLIS